MRVYFPFNHQEKLTTENTEFTDIFKKIQGNTLPQILKLINSYIMNKNWL